MAQDIKNLRNNSALAERNQGQNFPAMLKASMSEIARALPAHMSKDRMARVALTAFRRNPKLHQCDPRSVLAAVIQSAQLGLEPDTLGRSYLVPYKQECQFIPGWKGLVELVQRSGKGSVWTGAVFDGDEFDYALGDSPYLRHKRGDEDAPGAIHYFYAIGRPNGTEWPIIEVWSNARVTKHRDRYNRVGRSHYSFENWEMYGRKVPLMQVLKYMPMSVEVERAISLSQASEQGSQGITIDGVIDNTWEPPQDGPQDPAVGNDSGETATTAEAPAKQKKAAAAEKQQGSAPPAGQMSFEDAMDLIRTLPRDSEGEAEASAALDRFAGNERNMLQEIYGQRFGNTEAQPRDME